MNLRNYNKVKGGCGLDHVLEAIRVHYEVYFDIYFEEHKKGKYKKLNENPYYKEIKAIIDSMNVIRKYLGWDPLRLSEEVSWRLEDGI
jgi:hypothetical protein